MQDGLSKGPVQRRVLFYGMGHGRYRLAADDPSRVVMTKGKREIFSLAEKQGSSAEKPPGGSLVGVASAQQEQ